MTERTIEQTCAECGVLFQARTRMVAVGMGRFHDRVCALAFMRRELTIAPEVRFWARVDKSGGCWLWTGGLTVNGYGKFPLTPQNSMGAHRYSYELAHGVGSASGWFVCHRCDVRNCVRPDHLFLSDHDGNMEDMANKGRAAKGKDNGTHRYPERLARGESHYEQRLTDAGVRTIRTRAAAGETRVALAAEFGVSAALISQIVLRRKWRHVVD